MSRRGNVVYRPPESDSEDDYYDGFAFGDDIIKKKPSVNWYKRNDDELYEAVMKGDLEKIKQQVELNNVDVNEPVRCGFTILLHACKEGNLDIVEYLIEEKQADVNQQVDSITPLMNCCDSQCNNPDVIEKIAKILLLHGAVVNVADKYGTTPFMLACKNGHTKVVKLLLKEVSFDAVDNQGCTPIFHAIENNRADIVKILIDAGVNYTIANKKGYTPIQVAQFHGFYDLLEIFPKQKEAFIVPSQYLGYNTLRDYIPRIFLKSECPEYFQEINTILLSISMENFLEYFAKERVPLSQFLCMQDQRLKELGIQFPIYRMKIMKGLLDFHLHHWSKKSIARVNRSSHEHFYEILMITANHLQHLVIINSTLKFVKNHLEKNLLGPVTNENMKALQKTLKSYRGTIKELKKTTKYLASFSPPKNPLYIDYDEYLAERKRSKLKYYFKYTTIAIGISVFICLKCRQFF
ncbi:POTE ankyrin domain family member B [Stomoxys calcitrans]|uniref:POTE ankyrin domain family member B n=1 Tax=Stomoxys calcitrans TaxID=35570 RepID=UPI0027E3188A|nr:POTE ankyrin domain family member B [Stomoxys calcitrans]